MSNTAIAAAPEFTSARNPGGRKKPIVEAALANENQRINVPYDPQAWNHLGLDPEEFDLMSWFHMHCLDQGMTGKRIGAILGYDRTNASRILRGTYPASDWSGILAQIRAYKSTVTVRPTIGGIEIEPLYVKTEASDMFWQGIDYASRGGFTLLAGRSGAGKTRTVEEWDLRNPGRIIRMNAPATGGHVAMIRRLAKKLGVSHRKYSTQDILLNLDNRLTDRHILVIDQGSRLIPNERHFKATSLEVLMDINEETGCGIVIPLTMRDLERVGDLRYQIEQITGRAEIFAGPDPTLEQIGEIAAQFGRFRETTVAALHELALQRGGLRTVSKVLNLAHRVAKKESLKLDDSLIAGAIKNRFDRGAKFLISSPKPAIKKR
jgi:DNA transposition AAA+ family ATPase